MAEYSAENGVIGAILIEPECISEIYDLLRPEMFKSNFCRNVYTVCLQMYDRGKELDITTISSEVADLNVSAETISEQLSDCVINVPTSSHVKDYALLIARDYKSTQLANITSKIDLTPQNVDSQISDLIARLEELQANEKQKSKSLAEIVKENQCHYFDGKVQTEHISTGLDKLDNCICLEKGDVCVIGARPSVGKSAFANQIVLNAAKKGKRVGFFNLEMVESQVYERFLATVSEINLARIRNAINFLGDEKEKFIKGNQILNKLDIVVSAGTKTDMDIRNECRHQNFDLIVIDYLQLVRSYKKCESRRVEVGEVSRSLKALAMELQVPIILLSQLNRGTEHTQDREPAMADLRETGDIEQDASIIVLLWNLSQKAELKCFKGLKVEKNRQGELMDEALTFSGEYMTFHENDKSTLQELKDHVKNEEKEVTKILEDNPFL